MKTNSQNKIRFWFNNARPVALPQSVMPALTALFLALYEPGFKLLPALLAVIGGVLAHLSMNLMDDYFDYKNQETGERNTLAREGIRARTEKCSFLVNGEATLKQTAIVIAIYGILALIPGVILFIYRGWPLVIIVIITFILGESYSGKPLQLGYLGFGELIIGAIFGPLLMAGVYYSACGHFSAGLWAPAISMGLLVTNVVYVHSVLDQEADKRAGKATLAQVVGGKTAQIVCEFIFVFVPYILMIVMILLGHLHPVFWLIIVTLPMAVTLYRSVVQHQKNPEAPIVRSPLLGPMANWDLICQGGMDWFMLRWYGARNLMTAFSAIFIICSIIALIASR